MKEKSSELLTRSVASDLTKDQLVKLYSDMMLIRRFEEKAGQLYGMGMIGGFCHLCIGQEAIAVGMHHVALPGDSTITSYRDHGVMLASASDPKYVMAELMGKETGCSKGKGGSMHMFDKSKGFYGGHGIVGAQVPIGTGIAFANKYKNNDNVVFTCFGDGALNQGQVYEAFNMSALWKLPVVYVIENNEYAMGTSVSRSCSMTDLYKKGQSFNIVGHQVDGMNIFNVIAFAQMAREYCQSGQGPIILEVKTYRYRGHSMSDPATYRSKEELDYYKEQNDPIKNLLQYLINNKILDEEAKTIIDKKMRELVNNAVQFSENSNEPDLKELWTDIYKND